MISLTLPPGEEPAAHYGAEGQADTSGDSGFQIWFWFWSTLRLVCEQRFITWIKLRAKAETSHLTYTRLRSCSCALPHQPAELHGALHNSRLVYQQTLFTADRSTVYIQYELLLTDPRLHTVLMFAPGVRSQWWRLHLFYSKFVEFCCLNLTDRIM